MLALTEARDEIARVGWEMVSYHDCQKENHLAIVTAKRPNKYLPDGTEYVCWLFNKSTGGLCHGTYGEQHTIAAALVDKRKLYG